MASERGRQRGHVALLSLGALGVVYGDIGTSPLYAFREAIHATGGRATDPAAILGIASLVFWSLVIVVSIKYLAVVMRADSDGEGGILALTSLILPPSGSLHRRRLLVLAGLFGTALLYGDGIITPAISVLAAVEGLELAVPALGGWVLPIAVTTLVGLFALQHLGTATVGVLFGPIMITWFATLGVLGIRQILIHPQVLTAISPVHAITFVTDRPGIAFLALGGIFLVVTGAEALYADMGHFGRRPIRLAWFTIVLPCLVTNYFGQAALLLNRPEAATNPFFLMAPAWAVLPLVILATAATVIASQALISGAFSITMQAVQLGYLPRFRIEHTSHREFGQVYLPAVNAALMIACIALVLGFRDSTSLAAAYGMAVTATMAITTLLLIPVTRDRWRWPRPVTLVVIASFLAVDLAFLGANLIKIPAGGWLPLLVGAVIFVLMTTWHTGRAHVTTRRRLGTSPLEVFIANITRQQLPRIPGTAIYLGADLGQTPTSLEVNLATHQSLHRTILVVTVQTAHSARTTGSERAVVHDLGAGVHQVLLRFGFAERPDVPAALHQAVQAHLRDELGSATYFLGRETIVATTTTPGMATWRERLFVLLHRNASTAVRYFALPRDRIIEVGTIIEI